MPAIGSLPDDIDVTLFVPAPLQAADSEKFTRAAINFDIPTGVSNPTAPSVLATVAPDLGKVGNPSTQLARQIFEGVRPTDLPVETTDFLATRTLKMAQAIGLSVQEDLLREVDIISR